jgi:DNA-binding GntR family transcriptional regulator
VLSQVQLAEELGISRIPLREALRLLEREGLIESEINRRVRVTGLSIKDLDQLYAMRIQLESLAARLSVPRVGKQELEELNEHLALMRAAAEEEDYGAWEAPHRAFHDGLVAPAGGRLGEAIGQLSDHAERYRRAFMTSAHRSWSTVVKEHQAIFESYASGDPDLAAGRLARHYAIVVLGLIAELAPEYDPSALRTALRGTTHEHKPR